MIEMILRFVIETVYALGTIPIMTCLFFAFWISFMIDSPIMYVIAMLLFIIGLASRLTKCFGVNE